MTAWQLPKLKSKKTRKRKKWESEQQLDEAQKRALKLPFSLRSANGYELVHPGGTYRCAHCHRTHTAPEAGIIKERETCFWVQTFANEKGMPGPSQMTCTTLFRRHFLELHQPWPTDVPQPPRRHEEYVWEILS